MPFHQMFCPLDLIGLYRQNWNYSLIRKKLNYVLIKFISVESGQLACQMGPTIYYLQRQFMLLNDGGLDHKQFSRSKSTF